MKPFITELNYTYKKPDTEVWVLNTDDIPIDKEQIKDQQIVHLSPQSTGGNHKHPRIEWFVAIGELLFIWLDEKGERHQEHMNPDGKLRLFEVPPYLPHAVTNTSTSERGILVEFADGKMENVEPVKVF